jgi:hypothetical protein
VAAYTASVLRKRWLRVCGLLPRMKAKAWVLMRQIGALALLSASSLGLAAPTRATQHAPANPILFVTQVPVPEDFTTIGSVFGNHQADVRSTGRGGDLLIRYPDGALRNLTREAGYGMDGLQGANAIAVRDPALHWDGKKALFSMVVGATTKRYEYIETRWQIYEVSGFGIGETVVITKVANQPAQFNNISPIYGTDDRVIFTSDRPRDGAAHLYPQLDEYEEAPTVSGLWSLDARNGDLALLDHSPSGDFSPLLDSFGRVLFTRWDHLQRDQQADSESVGNTCSGGANYGTFNYSNESASAVANLNDRAEVFPEPRECRNDLLAGTNLEGHTFNHFFPWQVNEDGSELETINHIGRHELHNYFNRVFKDDANVVEFINAGSRTNPNVVQNTLQIEEDPRNPGVYYAVDAPEFYTHASGQIISFTAPPSRTADAIKIGYVTPRDTASYVDAPTPAHTGLYREPLPMADGTLVAVHTFSTQRDQNIGTRTNPKSRYDLRLRALGSYGAYVSPVLTLTNGISKSVSWWDPDELVTYSGLLWELNPVEVRARPRPARLSAKLPAPEAQMFAQAGVDPAQFQIWMRQRGLALSVSRNVTARDALDRQQPFNLRVPGGVQTSGATGKVYDVKFMQYFQGDQIRGLTGGDSTPNAGRRVLARTMHDAAAQGVNAPAAVPGAVEVATDGSQAAFVPARRAMSWQLTDAAGVPVVRERYWLTFQPGEVRVCASCHGLNSVDQKGGVTAQNPPQALLQLLNRWKQTNGDAPTLTRRVFLPLSRR